jgi:hypothetical protein
MIALTEAQICGTRRMRPLKIDRDDLDVKIADEIVNQSNREGVFLLAGRDDRCLVNADSRNPQNRIAGRGQ